MILFSGRLFRLAGVLAACSALALGCGRQSSKPRDVWVWLDAGLLEPSAKASALTAAVDSAAAMGARGIVVEVKSRTGEALIPTEAFPVAKEVGEGLGKGDVLAIAASRARAYGMRVAAGVYVFYGGNVKLKKGLAYQGTKDWCVVRYTRNGLLPDDENESLRWIRLSPASGEVRTAEIAFLRDVAARPEVEGVWLVGVEFPDIWSDFGPQARGEFQKWLGIELRKWPEDVCTRRESPESLRAGNWFPQWLYWRAEVLKDFVSEALRASRSVAPDKWLGVVVGGWLPRSFQQGVNWARPDYDFGNRWLASDYGETTFATTGVRLGIGLFFPSITEKEARKAYRRSEGGNSDPGWFSIEGCSRRAAEALPQGVEGVGVIHLGYYLGALKLGRKAVEATGSFRELLVFNATILSDEGWWARLLK